MDINAKALNKFDQELAEPKPKTQSEIISMLANLSLAEYDQIRRDAAKTLGYRTAILDKMVQAVRQDEIQSDGLPFPIVEPHPEPIDPSQLLDEIVALIHRFIILDNEQADAVALWIAFTWVIDAVEVAPLMVINAPEKACGKSQLLDLIGRMSARPLPAANSTTAALFRAVELWNPTVLIDEVDTFLRENDELKGIINAGHTRSNAFVLRVVGDDHTPKQFKVWGAKALAGIALEKHLPDSTMSRSIVIGLRRKLPNESVTLLRHAEKGLFERIAEKLARYAEDYSNAISLARPNMPDKLSDREQDNWEPLFAIAETAGEVWLNRATASALRLSEAGSESLSIGNELLGDIKEIFDSEKTLKISTGDLIAALVKDDEKSWATYNRGKQMSGRQLTKLLSGYGIKSKAIRSGYEVFKGYEANQFDDVFIRYLASPENAVTLLQSSKDEGSSVTD